MGVTDMAHHFTTRDKLNYLIGQVHTLADIGHDDRTDINVGGLNKPQSISSILARTIYTTDKSHAGDRSRDQSHAELELISNQLAGLISFFLLHAADISNSAKSKDLATYWSSRVLSEFFLQGDKEKELGLPISPLCDRDTVNVQDSQINFIKFVIQPTFELLGRIIPRANEEIRPNIDNNLEYWKQEKKQFWRDFELG